MLKSKVRPTGIGAIVAGLVLLALPRATADAQARDAPRFQTAVFAGGCFWSEEKAFDGLPAVPSSCGPSGATRTWGDARPKAPTRGPREIN